MGLLTELDDDLAKIIRMSRPHEEAHVVNPALILWLASEYILLYIRDTLHKKPNCEKYHSCNISSGAKFRLNELRDIGRVEDSHW